MKIAFVIDHLRADGTQRVLLQLVEGLARRHSIFVFCLNSSSDDKLVACLEQPGARVQIIGAPALLFGIGLIKLGCALRRENFDVVVTLLFVSDVVGRTLAHLVGVPRIVTSIRARNVNYSPLMRALSSATMRWADAIVLNARGVTEFAQCVEGAPRERIHIIPNGVETQQTSPCMTRAQLVETLVLNPNAHIIGSVGRLTEQKGFDVLLSALALLESGRVELILIGEGQARRALEQQANALGVKAHFLGYRRDAAQLIGAFDVYVQPSRFEGMSNAVLEAMASGCPIVATNVDGTRELIENGKHGWLVPPDDSAALAKAIQCALQNPQEARRRANAAQMRVCQEFSLEKMLDAWERVLTNA